jgi:hypothetical protein
MAISRMQMNRQLYAGGGIMDVTPREKFGLGSKFKKFVRKIIPNEIAEVATKAAPFVAPFNPLLAAGMAGIGGFDQTGSISKSLKSGLLTYGGGQAARYLGGAGFQKGFNPFAGADFSQGIMSGIRSLGTSPIGIDTGLKLGQYKMFGGPGADAFKASQMPVDPGIATESIFIQPGQPGTTYLPSDFATEALPLEPGSITSGGQIVSGTAAQNQAVLDQIAKQTVPGVTENVVQKATQRGYGDVFKDIFSGDLNKSTSALKELGGKALKDIYTDDKGRLDKNALFSTVAGVTSYIEAKKLLDEAGEDTEGYTEEMYEADKARYMEKYEELLNPEQFYATGGRVKLETGGIPSIMLAKKEYNFMDLIDKEGEDEYYEKKAEELDRKYNPERYKQILPKEKPMDKYMLDEVMSERGMRTLSEGTRDDAMKMYAERAYKKGQISEDEYREIMGFKVGGRVGYAFGSYYNEPGISERLIKDIDPEDLREMSPEELEKLKDKKNKEGITSLDNKMLMADAPGITFTKDEKSYLFRTLAGQGGSDRSFTMPQLYGILNNPNSDKNIGDAKALKAFLKMKGFKTGGRVKLKDGYSPEIIKKAKEKWNSVYGKDKWGEEILVKDLYSGGFDEFLDIFTGEAYEKKAYGGRIGYMMGSEVPVRKNQGGITELDYRNTGGFVPIGVKEKADDVPAMLSKNEFVFTADAVRAAGGGSVNKGAQKMYALMKQLEGKVV